MTASVTTPAITLRPVTDADRPFLLTVYEHTRGPELARVPWTVAQKAAFCAQQFQAQDTDYRSRWPRGRSLVVEADGEPAGRLYLGATAHELRVVDIALLPAYCGRGIGTALLRNVQAEAAARGVPVVLHVENWNPARLLYDRLGFVAVQRDDVYTRMEWRAVS